MYDARKRKAMGSGKAGRILYAEIGAGSAEGVDVCWKILKPSDECSRSAQTHADDSLK